MLAAYAARISPDDPLSGLEVADRPEPEARDGWTTVSIRSAGLNHHDVWSLRGVGLPAERLPMILGCDGAGVDPDGNEVIVHAVVASPGWTGDETLDPRRTLLSELHDGTLAEQVAVPTTNLVPKPAGMSWETAACLSTAWLTAYRMLFTNAGRLARCDGARPGRRGWRCDGAGPARRGGWVPHVGDHPRRGQGRQGAGDRRGPGVRLGGAAAGAGRRGDGDGRRGDLVALGQLAQPWRHHRDQWRDLG